MNTTPFMSSAALEQIKELTQMNCDSHDGFGYAAERLAEKHSTISMTFRGLAVEREVFANELRSLVSVYLDGQSVRGSVAASLHRTWMGLQDELNEMKDISAILTEIERSEDGMLLAYAKAIKDAHNDTTSSMWIRHEHSIAQSRDAIRSWIKRGSSDGITPS